MQRQGHHKFAAFAAVAGLLTGGAATARGITWGASIVFTLTLTQNFVAPGLSDQFSFFLLNPAGTGSVV